MELVIARNDRAAVYLGRCSVYPTGFELELRVLAAADAGELDPSLNGIYHRPGHGDNYHDMLRFGLEFDDGRKATNVGGLRIAGPSPRVPSYGEWAEAAEEEAGTKTSGCGPCLRLGP